jgi:hypothetical protein
MEMAVKRGADVLLIQEPPTFQHYSHLAFQYIWSPGRVMTARRITSDWTVSTEDRFMKECKGDVQVLALGRRNKQGRVLRVVNVYDNIVHKQGPERPARKANWEAILEEETIITGDLNAHSPKWNVEGDERRRNHHSLEKLIEHHGLILANDGSITRRQDGEGQNAVPGVIDLTLATPRIAHRVAEWKTLKEDGEATASDHEMIEWSYNSEERDVDKEHLVRGWSLAPLVGNTEEEKKRREAVVEDWQRMMRRREMLSDEYEREKLEKEAELFEEATREMLNKHARKIELCARSKRCWSEEIVQKRRKLGRIKRLWRQGRAQRGEIKEAKRVWQKAIREAKRKCWEDFLDSSVGMGVWTAV